MLKRRNECVILNYLVYRLEIFLFLIANCIYFLDKLFYYFFLHFIIKIFIILCLSKIIIICSLIYLSLWVKILYLIWILGTSTRETLIVNKLIQLVELFLGYLIASATRRSLSSRLVLRIAPAARSVAAARSAAGQRSSSQGARNAGGGGGSKRTKERSRRRLGSTRRGVGG